jgi:hypothetical protein
MGQEALCACTCNGTTAQVKALIEPPELILRGGLRRRIPFAAMRQVRAEGDLLRFTVPGESFSLALGSQCAAKWVHAVLKPPPSLAKKMGITPETTVRFIGTIDDAALEKALAEARKISKDKGELIVARVHAPRDLAAALKKAEADLARGLPVWLVYRKGPGHALHEGMVRSAGLAAGVVDTKVCALSEALTGLRFVKRRKP